MQFELGSAEHKEWLATDRTHEECDACIYVYAEFTPCYPKGHEAGPTHCRFFKEIPITTV